MVRLFERIFVGAKHNMDFIHSLTIYYIYFRLMYSDSKKYLQNFETFFYHFIFIVSNFCSYMKTLNDTNFKFNVTGAD